MTSDLDDIFEKNESTTTDAGDQIRIDLNNPSATPSPAPLSNSDMQPSRRMPILMIALFAAVVVFLMVLLGIQGYRTGWFTRPPEPTAARIANDLSRNVAYGSTSIYREDCSAPKPFDSNQRWEKFTVGGLKITSKRSSFRTVSFGIEAASWHGTFVGAITYEQSGVGWRPTRLVLNIRSESNP